MFYIDEEGENGQRGQTRAQTTPDESFGPQVDVFYIRFTVYINEEGSDGRRGQLRAQMTPYASFGPQVRVFLNINLYYDFSFSRP